MECLFYNPDQGIQIRAVGTAKLHTGNSVAFEAWRTVPLSNRINYCATVAPGATIAPADPIYPADWSEEGPTADQADAGFKNFAVVETRVSQFDWLLLETPYNHRIQLQLDEETGSWTRAIIAP